MPLTAIRPMIVLVVRERSGERSLLVADIERADLLIAIQVWGWSAPSGWEQTGWRDLMGGIDGLGVAGEAAHHSQLSCSPSWTGVR